MDECRLCGGPTQFRFACKVLSCYDVNYLECFQCGSLQTEPPYWLREAYSIPGVHIDTGQAIRVVQTWLRLTFMLERIGFDKTDLGIDYGGSAGLLTRLMRDSGYNFVSYDTFEHAKYASYYIIDSISGKFPVVITVFEVFEHLPEPRKTILELFSSGAELILFSTQLYEGQGPEWGYCVPFCGQHVFFYSRRALADFGAAHGLELRWFGDFWGFVRQGGRYSVLLSEVDVSLTPNQIGELIQGIGYGSDGTMRDFADALQRFERELPTEMARLSAIAQNRTEVQSALDRSQISN